MRRTCVKVTRRELSLNACDLFGNRSQNAGCLLGVDVFERDAVFDRSWSDVILDLPNGRSEVRVELSRSFWRDCPELRSAEIGQRLNGAGHGRWPKGNPPGFSLIKVSGNHFKVT